MFWLSFFNRCKASEPQIREAEGHFCFAASLHADKLQGHFLRMVVFGVLFNSQACSFVPALCQQVVRASYTNAFFMFYVSPNAPSRKRDTQKTQLKLTPNPTSTKFDCLIIFTYTCSAVAYQLSPILVHQYRKPSDGRAG